MEAPSPAGRALLLRAALSCLLLSAPPAAAQAGGTADGFKRICPVEMTRLVGYKVRSVKALGRRGVGPVNEKLEAEAKKLDGRLYTVDFHRKAMETVVK